jgi:hypothetical protein
MLDFLYKSSIRVVIREIWLGFFAKLNPNFLTNCNESSCFFVEIAKKLP